MVSVADQDKPPQTERRRNFEIFKYGHAVRINHDDNDIDPVPSEIKPRLAEDAILTGLCKLMALQLRCRNAFICLIDSSRQHIIAESTQTLSPYDENVHGPDDGLLFGVQSVYTEYAITNITLSSYTGSSKHFISNQYTSVSDQSSIFLDLHHESAVSEVPFIKAYRQYRFYAEVPLKNASGIVVGAIGTLDTKPRLAFDEVDVRSLLDVARLTMEHLELLRLRDTHAYAERLIQGLGCFNAGQSSLGQTFEDHSTVVTDCEETGKSFMPSHPEALQSTSLSTLSVPPSIQPEQSFSTLSPGSTQTSDNGVPTWWMQPNESPAAPDRNPPPVDLSSDTGDTQNQSQSVKDDTPTDINKALARAANLIREAMDLDAACFIDILPSLHMDAQPHSDHLGSLSHGSDVLAPAAPTDLSDTSALTTSESESRDALQASVAYCRQIAHSSKQSSCSTGNGRSDIQTRLSRKAMRVLLSMYPKGHVFNFDSLGFLSTSDDSEHVQSTYGPQSRRRKVAQTLSESFGGARSLIFLPLYDYEQQKKYCAFFGWINEPLRALSEKDITYVSGFANSIMCEIMRLETLSIERAKTAFISSISHELRSPLHGILAATELLQESEITDNQNEFALMVGSCGRTLLDIINNLLEYANINNKIDRKPGRRRRLRQKGSKRAEEREQAGRKQSQDSHSTAVNLAQITEETIESVAAGHTPIIQRSEQDTNHPTRPAGHTKDIEPGDMRAPTVVLDFERRDNWCFNIDAGAWRRIVMNLVGNALKYTSSGHIVVGMHLKKSPDHAKRSSHRIVLTVSDSGRGISGSYMKSKLYTPFAQEDRLSVGVGLGLSIVYRLVAELGGKININSEINVGTEVSLVIPLSPSIPAQGPANLPIPEFFSTLRQKPKKDKSICFCGFDILPALETSPTGTMSSRALGLLKLKRSLSTMAEDWLGLTTTTDVRGASMCIVEADYGQSLLQEHPEHEVFATRYAIICTYNQAFEANIVWPGINTTLATPIGPAKLARQLLYLLQETHKLDTLLPGPAASDHSAQLVQPIEVSAARETSPCRPMQLDTDSGIQPAKLHRILLVDDNEINLRILAALVKKLHLPYELAKNGREAVDQFVMAHEQGQPYNYVFMDISMPVMDGLTSTRHIRAYEKAKVINPPASIFALTGLGDVKTQTEAFESGIDQYFRKPVKLNNLREVLITS